VQAILDVQGIRKSLGEGEARQVIIGDLTFAARPGEFVSVVGPSGCGKTTLLMCLAGLYGVDAGSVRFEQQAVSSPPPGLSVVFQDYSRSLLPWKNNLDNVLFGMKRTTLAEADKRQRAGELLVAVGLAGYEQHFPWQVSGGMQQRVAIARGLAAQSRLLLLDEPLAAVDAQTRAELQDLLLDLAKRFNQTCLLVTHDVDEAVYMADRVIVLTRRPTRVMADLPVRLAKPRDQLATREHPDYLHLRHEVITMIRSMRQAA
jgi:NitT/TauT family transport system ATP-binding protein